MKDGVASKNLPNTMLSHEEGDMRIVQPISGDVRKFFEHLLGHRSRVSDQGPIVRRTVWQEV